MANDAVDKKPSRTALLAALRRALAHKDYHNEKFGPDNLAEFFLPSLYRFFIKFEKMRVKIKTKLNSFLPGLTEYMIARTAFFNNVFKDALDKNIPQIVILGAGYDTRVFRYARMNKATKIMELDIATTQNLKLKCLKKAKIEIPDLVSFIPINFNTESLIDVLEKAGYDRKQKTLFIWEGITYYLENQAVDATLDFVKKFSHNESMLTFDYTISISEKNIDAFYGVREFIQTMAEYHSNESLLFNIDEGHIKPFLKDRGLRLIEHMDNKEIEKKFLTTATGTLIGKCTGHFRFVTAGVLGS